VVTPYYQDDLITLYLADCLPMMREMSDKAFDLAIVDPQFGIGISRSARLVTDKGLQAKAWDDVPISPDYFKDLFRVSINQIIWGGNYYALPPARNYVAWDKLQPEGLSFGMFDLAWTSFDTSNKMFRRSSSRDSRIHPTQKPAALYRWLLKNYAKPGDTILDTHAGSCSLAIACHDLGFTLTAFEIDEEYLSAAVDRIKRYLRQPKMFKPVIVQPEQESFL